MLTLLVALSPSRRRSSRASSGRTAHAVDDAIRGSDIFWKYELFLSVLLCLSLCITQATVAKMFARSVLRCSGPARQVSSNELI